jgi:agmatine deiminase
MNNRRQFIKRLATGGSALLVGSALSACGGGDTIADGVPPSVPPNNVTPPPILEGNWLMPDEADAHKATWMAFAASQAIWGADLVLPVQACLARIANAIVQYEPVNMLVNQSDFANAKQKLDPRVNLIIADIDDLWMRDTGPVFVRNAVGEKAGVNFNFNGWGNKQTFTNDKKVAGVVTAKAGVRLLSSKLVLEGGGIEVDGKGTAIITESCVLNTNRNPGLSKADCETELKRLLGIRKVIWLPGIVGKDITDAHTDFYARFVRPGLVIAAFDTNPASYDHAVTKRHLDILRAATDVDNKPLQIVVLDAPTKTRPEYASNDFAAGYINFYVANGAVFVPEFGDAIADVKAKTVLAELFPGRVVVQINIDPIALGGGGIHCTTQQESL